MCSDSTQVLQLGHRLTSSQKLHGALRSSRKRLAEDIFAAYQQQFADAFGFRHSGDDYAFELLAMRIVNILVSGNRHFVAPASLLCWISGYESIAMQREDKIWESLALMFQALSAPEARLAREQKGKYKVSFFLFGSASQC